MGTECNADGFRLCSVQSVLQFGFGYFSVWVGSDSVGVWFIDTLAFAV